MAIFGSPLMVRRDGLCDGKGASPAATRPAVSGAGRRKLPPCVHDGLSSAHVSLRTETRLVHRLTMSNSAEPPIPSLKRGTRRLQIPGLNLILGTYRVKCGSSFFETRVAQGRDAGARSGDDGGSRRRRSRPGVRRAATASAGPVGRDGGLNVSAGADGGTRTRTAIAEGF
jgi:hypothetical protein